MAEIHSSFQVRRSLCKDLRVQPPRESKVITDLFSSERVDGLISFLGSEAMHVSSDDSRLGIGYFGNKEMFLVGNFSFVPQEGVNRIGVKLVSSKYVHPAWNSDVRHTFELTCKTYTDGFGPSQCLDGNLIWRAKTAQEMAAKVDEISSKLHDFYASILHD